MRISGAQTATTKENHTKRVSIVQLDRTQYQPALKQVRMLCHNAYMILDSLSMISILIASYIRHATYKA